MNNIQAMLGLVCLLYAGTSPGSDSSAEAAVRTGEFELVLTLTEAAGTALAEVASSVILPDEKISWEVYVPDNYHPDKPAGLLVYISPPAISTLRR